MANKKSNHMAIDWASNAINIVKISHRQNLSQKKEKEKEKKKEEA